MVYMLVSKHKQMSIEHKYLHLLESCLNSPVRDTRNAQCHSIFGAFLEHDLQEGFPLLTTKKVFFRGVIEELAWFLRGSTNVQELKDKNVHIWDKNAEEYDIQNGIDAGGIYGFLWRHMGAKYVDCHTDYTEKGIDQITSIINDIKHSPNSRRHVLCAWNPSIPASLPPCHVLYQFYVQEGKLSVQMYQRSADLFLGVPFNIASTALLTHLIANECDLDVGTMRIIFGDAHIYTNHVQAVHEQLGRIPKRFPQISIVREKDNLWNLKEEDIELLSYDPEPAIRAEMIA